MAEAELASNEKIYKCYITDLLKAIAESLGISVNENYRDIIKAAKTRKTKEKTGNEIALSVIKGAGLKVK